MRSGKSRHDLLPRRPLGCQGPPHRGCRAVFLAPHESRQRRFRTAWPFWDGSVAPSQANGLYA
jgi:hypothetical protein